MGARIGGTGAGVIFSGFSYFKTFRKAAASIIGEERATYLALRDLRHATITELAEHTRNLAAVAAHPLRLQAPNARAARHGSGFSCNTGLPFGTPDALT